MPRDTAKPAVDPDILPSLYVVTTHGGRYYEHSDRDGGWYDIVGYRHHYCEQAHADDLIAGTAPGLADYTVERVRLVNTTLDCDIAKERQRIAKRRAQEKREEEAADIAREEAQLAKRKAALKAKQH